MANCQRKLGSIAGSFVVMHLLKLADFYYKKKEKELLLVVISYLCIGNNPYTFSPMEIFSTLIHLTNICKSSLPMLKDTQSKLTVLFYPIIFNRFYD